MKKEKNNIPPQYHYDKNIRISPILLETDMGWALIRSEDDISRMGIGEHGWNNTLEDMQSIFFAKGSMFNITHPTGSIDNIEIYNLMCNILNVPPAPNNGTQLLSNILLKK